MRRRVRATPSRALKASHIPEPSARAFVLRAPCPGAGRAGGARARGAPLGAGRRVFDLRGARANT